MHSLVVKDSHVNAQNETSHCVKYRVFKKVKHLKKNFFFSGRKFYDSIEKFSSTEIYSKIDDNRRSPKVGKVPKNIDKFI